MLEKAVQKGPFSMQYKKESYRDRSSTEANLTETTTAYLLT